MLIEELFDLSEEFQETQEMCAVHGPWRKKKEEILPLLTEEDKEKEGSN